MSYPGFAIVHIQSPCTTYNDTFALLKGDEKANIEPAGLPPARLARCERL